MHTNLKNKTNYPQMIYSRRDLPAVGRRKEIVVRSVRLSAAADLRPSLLC
jgi:hypothetical protein